MTKNKRALLRLVSVASLVLAIGCKPVELVTVVLQPEGSGCEDKVSNGSVTLDASEGEGVVWRLVNQCQDAEVKIELTDKEPVTNCVTSPYQANFALGQKFPMALGATKHVFCSVYGGAAAKKYVYKITAEIRRSTGEMIPLSHELDIGVNP